MPLGYLFFNQINADEFKKGIGHTFLTFAADSRDFRQLDFAGWLW